MDGTRVCQHYIVMRPPVIHWTCSRRILDLGSSDTWQTLRNSQCPIIGSQIKYICISNMFCSTDGKSKLKNFSTPSHKLLVTNNTRNIKKTLFLESFQDWKNLSILFLTINYIDRKGSEKVSNYSKRTGRRSYPLMNKWTNSKFFINNTMSVQKIIEKDH